MGDGEMNENIKSILIKMEASRLAEKLFVTLLVQHLIDGHGLNGELLLERLHIGQSHLPGVRPDFEGWSAEHAKIAKEVLSAFRTYAEAVDDAIGSGV